MAKQNIDESVYNNCIRDLWKLEYDIGNFFPAPIAKWIEHKATILGVSPTYIAWPLLITTSYAMQHTFVSAVNGIHVEPVILFGLVGGRSGTNKSAALNSVISLVNDIRNEFGQEHIFESGTLEGLMKAMSENNGCTLGCYDEFATFLDGLDKGASCSFERSRYLSLFNGSNWSKKQQTSGSLILKDPRFHLLSFTQPYSLINFARQGNHDGFFQRFLITCPKEVYIRIEEKESSSEKSKDGLQMKNILAEVYSESCTNDINNLHLSDDAMEIYRTAHDEIVDYRERELYKEDLLSVKSKSLGLILRVSGVINRLREANFRHLDKEYTYRNEISKEDITMARSIVDYSFQSSMLAIGDNRSNNVPQQTSNLKKSSIPEPEIMSVEFLVAHARFVQRLLAEDDMPLSKISRDNIYPTINGEKNGSAANRFVRGLCALGLGEIKEIVNCKGVKHQVFTRNHPYKRNDNMPGKENVISIWKRLNLSFPKTDIPFSCSQPTSVLIESNYGM